MNITDPLGVWLQDCRAINHSQQACLTQRNQWWLAMAQGNALSSAERPRYLSINPTRQMTDLEVERFNRAGLLRRA